MWTREGVVRYEFILEERLSATTRDAFPRAAGVQRDRDARSVLGTVLDGPHLHGPLDRFQTLGLTLVEMRRAARLSRCPGLAVRSAAGHPDAGGLAEVLYGVLFDADQNRADQGDGRFQCAHHVLVGASSRPSRNATVWAVYSRGTRRGRSAEATMPATWSEVMP